MPNNGKKKRKAQKKKADSLMNKYREKKKDGLMQIYLGKEQKKRGLKSENWGGFRISDERIKFGKSLVNSAKKDSISASKIYKSLKKKPKTR